jgi:hypothetical protein
MEAHLLIEHNKEKVEKIADEVIEKREIYGNDLLDLLNRAELERPTVDYTDEKVWPRI